MSDESKEPAEKTDEKKKLFDGEKAKVRHDHLMRMFKAHDVPDDGETGVVMVTEGVRRLVQHYGPHAMGTFAMLFVDTWRQAEGNMIKGILIESLVDSFLQKQPESEMKH